MLRRFEPFTNYQFSAAWPGVLRMKMRSNARYGNHHPARFEPVNEQTASTSRASEQSWLITGLGLMVLVIGLYWFSERHQDQSAWAYQPVVKAQVTVEQPARFELSDPMTTQSENQTIPSLSPNERLVRQFYDKVA
jgi:hypothetical protein